MRWHLRVVKMRDATTGGVLVDGLAALGIETGFGDPYTEAAKEGAKFLTSLDLGGTAKKRERTAKAERDGAIALRDKAMAELKAAELMAGAALPVVAPQARAPSGVMATLQAPSFIPGVPWWGVAAGVAVAAWALWPKG